MQISFPQYQFELRSNEGQRQLYDIFRKRWIAINPEEWVRQHLLWHFVERGYPRNRIAVERKVEFAGQSLRFDAVIYDDSVQAWMIVECKAPGIKLDDSVLQQALRYNSEIKAPFICLCNGEEMILIQHDKGNSWAQIKKLPDWPAASGTE